MTYGTFTRHNNRFDDQPENKREGPCSLLHRNFLQTNRFVGEVSRAAETQWAGLQQLCPRLIKIRPDVQSRFRSTAAKVRVNAQQRLQGLRGGQTTATPTDGVRVSRRVNDP